MTAAKATAIAASAIVTCYAANNSPPSQMRVDDAGGHSIDPQRSQLGGENRHERSDGGIGSAYSRSAGHGRLGSQSRDKRDATVRAQKRDGGLSARKLR
jgi:hypothetical protein